LAPVISSSQPLFCCSTGTTRGIYEKKLAKLLGTASPDVSVTNGSPAEASVEENGSFVKNGEFSADEATEEDEAQPSVVVKKATPLRLAGCRDRAIFCRFFLGGVYCRVVKYK
jgi:hypothetical protein